LLVIIIVIITLKKTSPIARKKTTKMLSNKVSAFVTTNINYKFVCAL